MVRKRPAVLIVDDEEAICDLVCEELAERGYASFQSPATSRIEEG